MSRKEDIIAGVGPGGLRDNHDVKILICYLLHTLKSPLPREKMAELLTADGITDYFTFSASFEELVNMGHLKESVQGFELTALGAATATALQGSLPVTLREKVAAEGAKALQMMQKESEVRTEIVPHHNGYHVRCTMDDGELEFLNLAFYAPDLTTAERIRRRLTEQSTNVYTALMKMLT